MSIKLTEENGELLVRFSFSEEKVRKIKTISGRRWDSDQRAWILPMSDGQMQRLMEVFKGEDIIFTKSENNAEDNPLKTRTVENLKALEALLKLKAYSPKTLKSYLGHVRRFLWHMSMLYPKN